MVQMSDLLNLKIKEQLQAKGSGAAEPPVFPELEQMEIPSEEVVRAELEKQKRTQQALFEDEAEVDEWAELLADKQPIYQEESPKVKVEIGLAGGYVGYVDLTFSELDKALTNDAYQQVSKNLELMSSSQKRTEVLRAAQEIEKIGDKAVGAIFRKIYLFDFSSKEERYKLEALVQMCTRLMVLSLNGRMILKGVLQGAKNEQHLELAIRVAGQINDREVVPEILEHAKKPALFIPAMEALLRMRNTEAVRELLPVIDALDAGRKDIIGEAISLAYSFRVLQPSIVKSLFYTYMDTAVRALRPIYSVAIKSFGDLIVPVLYDILETEGDIVRAREAAKMIGGLRTATASEKLQEAYRRLPAKRTVVMEGIAHTLDAKLAPFVAEELQKADNQRLKEACMKALATLGDESYIPQVKPYAQQQTTKLSALYALVRLGDAGAFRDYLHLLVAGTSEEQQQLRSYTSLLSFKHLTKIAERLRDLPDSQAVQILLTLQRPNVLPKEIGPILRDVLHKRPSAPVRLETYRLIAKFAHTKNELLPASVFYEARKTEQDPLMKRQMEQIYKGMSKSGKGAFIGYDGERA
ncbi:hypothetical protein [Ectobacillus ponti]|uniref:HEAT repeat domain-containing protein n=1 Tax=Ectobacillus ponti TaxID=2961894 RepID=A0AA41XCH6_9BACI|nr:hypothetical protein [Ectobacillus ponti]MCP8970910.1 hypothetical protein [Ectobacillus ponti]